MATPQSPRPSPHLPDIVLLHGANGCRSELQAWRLVLAQHGFKTHAFNMAGHGGRVIPPQLSMQAFTQDLLEQLDKASLHRPIVLGYSFGGLLALYLARHHPDRVRAVVSLATKYIFDADAVQHFTHLLQVPRLTQLAHRREHLSRVHHPNDWRKLVEALHGFFAALGSGAPLTMDDLHAISCPVLVLSGSKDQLVKAAETQSLHRCLARSRLAMYEGIAHPVDAVPTAGMAKAVKAWADGEGFFRHDVAA